MRTVEPVQLTFFSSFFSFFFWVKCHVMIRLSDSPAVRRSERPTGAAPGWKCSRSSLGVQEVQCYLNRFHQPEGRSQAKQKKKKKRLFPTWCSASWDTALRKGSVEKMAVEILP